MKNRFLRWLNGWASLMDGMFIILSLGYYDPGLSVKVLEKILLNMMDDCKKESKG